MFVRLGMIPTATALSERDPGRGGSRRIVRSHGVKDVVRVGVTIGDSGGHTSCEDVVCVCESWLWGVVVGTRMMDWLEAKGGE
jgi:hypothetical protein